MWDNFNIFTELYSHKLALYLLQLKFLISYNSLFYHALCFPFLNILIVFAFRQDGNINFLTLEKAFSISLTDFSNILSNKHRMGGIVQKMLLFEFI